MKYAKRLTFFAACPYTVFPENDHDSKQLEASTVLHVARISNEIDFAPLGIKLDQFPLKKGMEHFPRKKIKPPYDSIVRTNYNVDASSLLDACFVPS